MSVNDGQQATREIKVDGELRAFQCQTKLYKQCLASDCIDLFLCSSFKTALACKKVFLFKSKKTCLCLEWNDIF